MNEPQLPKGFVCRCGKQHRFSLWVYAHFDEQLEFTCPDCGCKFNVWQGVATLTNGCWRAPALR